MKTTIAKKRKQTTRGFTLLLAALAASIALVLGTSIFEISSKQVQLSAIGRDSQFAFYAADTAAECALYWDDRYAYFASSTPKTAPGNDPHCDTQPLKNAAYVENPTRDFITPQRQWTITFQFEPNGYCAIVTVLKCASDSLKSTPPAIQSDGTCNPVTPLTPPNQPYETLVHANGYNVKCSDISTNPNALERSVELNY